MAFQVWRDYLQLRLVIQEMTRAEASKPSTAREVLQDSTNIPGDHHPMPEHSDDVQPNPSFAEVARLSPVPEMRPKSRPTCAHRQADSPSSSAQDHAVTVKSSRLHPNSPITLHSGKPKASARAKVRPNHRQTATGAMCLFCAKNGEMCDIYRSHNLKDEQGRIACPILRIYVCPLCGATGDSAHTKIYCPLNKDKTGVFAKRDHHSSRRCMSR